MIIIIVILCILVYSVLGGATMAVIYKLYEYDVEDLGWLAPFVFVFAPLVLTGIGGYEITKRLVNK